MEKIITHTPNVIEEPNATWDQMHVEVNENTRDSFKESLWQQVVNARENPFPHSTDKINKNMPTEEDGFDPRVHHLPYLQALEQYQFQPADSEHHFFGGESNIGYKLRLNIALADVQRVSEYLKEKGLNHKFLSGADGSGEVFTVYTGSKDRTDAVAQLISTNLSDVLCRPVGNKELEFAPNVAGYFTTPSNPFGLLKDGTEFTRYPSFKRGIRGIPSIKYMDEAPTVSDERAYAMAYDQLSKTFGTYFYGSGPKDETRDSKFDALLKEKFAGKTQRPMSAFDRLLKEKLQG